MSNIKKAIIKVDEFARKNNIDYMLTGTCALEISGLCPDDYVPQDIDVQVLSISEEASAKLREMQYLQGHTSKYEGPCITVEINRVKVNFLPATDNVEYHVLVNTDGGKIKVQTAICALKDKMALKRPKDENFLLNLIAKIAKL